MSAVGRSLAGDQTLSCCDVDAFGEDARKEGYDGDVMSVPQESSGWVTSGEGASAGKNGDETVGIVGKGCMNKGGGRVLRRVRALVGPDAGDPDVWPGGQGLRRIQWTQKTHFCVRILDSMHAVEV
jgi:hypothetical protein